MASEPQLLHVLAPAEAVVVIAIEVRVGSNSGLMNLAIPSIFIKRLRHKFDQLRHTRKAASTVEDQDHISHLIQHATLVFEARINGGSISGRRLLDLKAGDVVVLNHPLDRKVCGLLNGVEKCVGSIVSKGDRLAFEVQADEFEQPCSQLARGRNNPNATVRSD
jgi:flagellar motor switch protein FliM